MNQPMLKNEGNGKIVREIASVIVANKQYLSEIDGKIGDGDHGVNMAKGFARASERITDDMSLSDALEILSGVLMGEIGGSMGPLYGVMFEAMSEAIEETDVISSVEFEELLEAGLQAIGEIGAAKVGDKTLMDTLVPASAAFSNAVKAGSDFTTCLESMVIAAEKGKDSTKDLVAKIGRAARLGERSKGVVDAGATSCFLILDQFSQSINKQLMSVS